MTQTTLSRQGSILLLSDVEALLGMTADTLRKYVLEGRLPRPRHLGKAVFWRRSELEAAIAKAPPAPKWRCGVVSEASESREEAGAA